MRSQLKNNLYINTEDGDAVNIYSKGESIALITILRIIFILAFYLFLKFCVNNIRFLISHLPGFFLRIHSIFPPFTHVLLSKRQVKLRLSMH